MARHRPDASSGLLSNVFSFVSREFESFVLNATARTAHTASELDADSHAHPQASQPVPTERVKTSGGGRGRDAERHVSEDEARCGSKTQHRSERERRSKRELSRRKPRSKSTGTTKRYRQGYVQPTYIVDDDRGSDQERSRPQIPRLSTSFPVSPVPKLKKQLSFTMPGALFPRSPSLMPDQSNMGYRTHNSAQRTRPPHATDSCETEPGPSSVHPSTGPSADAVLDQPSFDDFASPWRTRSVASVKDAVQRFNATDGAEADFSLMLPSPHSSPVRPVSNLLSTEEMSPSHLTSGTPLIVSGKGKERARDVRNDEDLDFIVGGGPGCGGVHTKERELDAAREEQREHERLLIGDQSNWASDERERDKRRIKVLEEEVRRLKEELSKSQTQSSFTVPPAPPPPPPPPPPPAPPPLRINTAPCTPTTMFVNARASLRHATTPVEAPINPVLSKSRRQGQPTVNVPSEKMAAFLQEIMTAKLRKVGSGPNAMGGDGVAGPSGLSKSLSVTSSSAPTGIRRLSAQELQRRRSLASLRVPIGSSRAAPVPASVLAAMRESEARVGQKRKADTLDVDELTVVPSKRFMTEPSSWSPEASQHTTTSELSLGSNLSLPPRSLSTNETDVTTPSLCSDNDRDENSIEDQVPSTPPGPRSTVAAQKPPTTDDVPGEQIEVIDVEMEEQSHPEARPISSNTVPRRTSDLFKKRPPGSPIHIPTPRRPSAPARTKRGATPKPKNITSLESDVDGDRLPSQPAPVPFISLIPVSKTKTDKKRAKHTLTGRPRTSLPQQNGRTLSESGSNSQSKCKKGHKRRQTLDEELRMAEAYSSDVDECNDEHEEDEPEEDVFIAKGTKSKRRGFLAHGGGGGVPVFMGVGHVEGAVLDSENENGTTSVRPRRPSKPTSQVSLIPRPKARP